MPRPSSLIRSASLGLLTGRSRRRAASSAAPPSGSLMPQGSPRSPSSRSCGKSGKTGKPGRKSVPRPAAHHHRRELPPQRGVGVEWALASPLLAARYPRRWAAACSRLHVWCRLGARGSMRPQALIGRPWCLPRRRLPLLALPSAGSLPAVAGAPAVAWDASALGPGSEPSAQCARWR